MPQPAPPCVFQAVPSSSGGQVVNPPRPPLQHGSTVPLDDVEPNPAIEEYTSDRSFRRRFPDVVSVQPSDDMAMNYRYDETVMRALLVDLHERLHQLLGQVRARGFKPARLEISRGNSDQRRR